MTKTLQQLIDEREELKELYGEGSYDTPYKIFTANHDTQIIDGLLDIIKLKDEGLRIIARSELHMRDRLDAAITMVDVLQNTAKQALSITTNMEAEDE